MDFCQVLHTAQKNEKNAASGVRYYNTKFEPPKKEKKNNVQLSDNIKKFLARKEAEEKKKAAEEKKRKEELLALRSQDKKATRRVNVMLKRTKSANQSVLDDAVDNDNTAVTLAGPMQPDEDDYGYVSQEASAYYEKMMEKYNKMPEEPKFDMSKKKVSTDLASTKDKVRAALEKEREEAMLPHKRKRKHKDGKQEDDDEGLSFEAPDKPGKRDDDRLPPPPPKSKPRPAPPPMNFMELLKIAEKKQFEPIVIEKKEKEEEVLLTKKQRKELEREKEFQKRREERRKEMENQGKDTKMNRIPKIGDQATKQNTTSQKVPSSSSSSNGERKVPESKHSDEKRSYESSNRSVISSKSKDNKSVPSSINGRSNDLKSKSALEDSRLKKALLKDSKRSPDYDPPQRKHLSGDVKTKNLEQDQRKYLPGDIRSKGQIQVDRKSLHDSTDDSKMKEDSRKFLPGDIRYKGSQNEAPQRKYLPGDVRANSQEAAQKKASGGIKSQNSQTNISRQKSQDNRHEVKSKPLDPKRSVSGSSSRENVKPKSDLKPKQLQSADKSRQFSQDVKPRQFPPADVKPRQFPPPDVRSRQFPPPDVRRREPPSNNKKKPNIGSKRRILDDDSEYDSEMDDFIDDDDAGEDYSKYISEIFGYDKSKYRDRDEDVGNMESTFAQQMREEVISTKIGIMEDLEDMRMEEEAKRRKLNIKKKRRID